MSASIAGASAANIIISTSGDSGLANTPVSLSFYIFMGCLLLLFGIGLILIKFVRMKRDKKDAVYTEDEVKA